MPLKLPIRSSAARIKSPAPRPKPSRDSRLSVSSPTRQSSSAHRSRSHDPPLDHRRHRDSSASRYPPGSSSGRPRSRHRSPDPASPPPASRHDRRRRRGSSSSPERFDGRRGEGRDRHERGRRDYNDDDADYLRRARRQSLAAEKDRDGHGRRPASVDYRNPPRLRPGAAPGAFNREGENDPRNDDRRPRTSTPDKYKPDKYKKARSPSPKPTKAAKQESKPEAKPAAASPPSMSPAASSLFGNMPTAIAAYAGLKTLSKQADNAKEWINWLSELSETPEEIQELADKADLARDTVSQVQQLIKARPDLLEGDKQAEALKEQIDEAVKSTDKALAKMSRLLAEISKKGADQGDAVNGMKEFWRSYRYKDEYEEKVKKADDDVQKELAGLSTLMMNLNARALIKPPPAATPTAAAATPAAAAPVATTKETPEPAKKTEGTPIKEEAKKAAEKPQAEPLAKPQEASPAAGKKDIPIPTAAVPTIVEPPSDQALKDILATQPDNKKSEFSHPPSPGVLADEEAALGSPPSPGTQAFRPNDSSASLASRESSEANSGKRRGSSPVPIAPTFKPRQDSKVAEEIERRASVSAKLDQPAEDMLLDAAWDGDLDTAVKALRQVSPRIADERGVTPLHLAAERDNLSVAMLLLDRGALISARSDGGRTPLHLAARSATAPMVEMLLERGKADPNAETAKGRTALHYAASKARDGDEERREVLRTLRDFGADPTIQDREGETARDVAQSREHWDASATLRRAEKTWEEDHKQGWLKRHGFLK